MSGEPPVGGSRAERIESLFHALVERPAAERETRLVAEASRDPDVASRVRALLAAAGEAEGFFAALPGRIESAQDEDSAGDLRGRRVGAYVIDALIGRGGMGAVYRAHRADEQYEKHVAIKLVPQGLLSATARERFRQERQTLARLEHPNIARLLDGGVLEDGTPYLVMELVDGQPLDQWCDARKLGVRERVELLLPVLDAVQYAHQSLVLHRDLKPDNVLVSERGEVKLLDFGIARTLDESGAEGTLTRQSSPLTPAYASPEQLRGESLTTASDVYSLGAMAYAVLTGARAHDVTGKSTAEIARLLSEQPPRRPSTVVRSASDAVAAERATVRGSSPESLAHALSGDLDTVVLTAMHGDPARRYASASAFADDLRAHLEGRPVSARGDDASYVFSRFVRRHRAAVAIAVAALVAVLGLAFVLAGLSARHAREMALERDKAQREARTAEAVADFLATLFDGADPDVSGGRELTARELLDQSARRLEADLAGQPEVHARMSNILATLYEKLGRSEEAIALAARAAAVRARLPGAGGAQQAASLEQQARLLQELDRGEEADSVLRVAERLRRESGTGLARMAPSIEARGYLASDRFEDAAAESLLALADSLFRTEARPDSEALAHIADARGYLALSRSPRAADSLFALAAAIDGARRGPDHSSVAAHERGRGQALLRLERYVDAERVLRSARDRLAPLFGGDHYSVIACELYLANALSHLERFDEADSLLQHVLAVRRARLGDAHPNTINVLNMLGLMHRDAGHDAQAIQYLKQAADAYRQRGPQMAVAVHIVEGNLADAMVDAKRYAEAVPLLNRLRAETLANPRHTPWQVARMDLSLARAAYGLGRRAEAERGYRAALDGFDRSEGGAAEASRPVARYWLGRLLDETGRSAEAIPLLRAAATAFAAQQGGEHPATLRASVRLAGALSAAGRLAEADTMLARARGIQARKLPETHTDRREAEAIARAHAARMAKRG